MALLKKYAKTVVAVSCLRLNVKFVSDVLFGTPCKSSGCPALIVVSGSSFPDAYHQGLEMTDYSKP